MHFDSFDTIILCIYRLFICVVPSLLILAAFGFRGTSTTALIGMATAIFFYWICKKCTFSIGFDSYLICALGNGLGMMAAHYLLPQPVGKG